MARKPEWTGMQPVKQFEGVEIRLDPESGKFGALLGPENLRILKDLKELEREILAQKQTVRVLFTDSYRPGPGTVPEVKEVVRFKDGRYLFKGGDRASYGLFEYDEAVLRDLEGLEQEHEQLMERWEAVRQRLVPLSAARYAALKQEGES